ncbi:hypothetical protein D3C81_1698070 [compost metagenome]
MALFIRAITPSSLVNNACTSLPSFLSFNAALNLVSLNSRVPSLAVLIPSWLSEVNPPPVCATASSERSEASNERVVGSPVRGPSTVLPSSSLLVEVRLLTVLTRLL